MCIYVCMYIYMYMCVCVCIYIYTYISTPERDNRTRLASSNPIEELADPNYILSYISENLNFCVRKFVICVDQGSEFPVEDMFRISTHPIARLASLQSAHSKPERPNATTGRGSRHPTPSKSWPTPTTYSRTPVRI